MLPSWYKVPENPLSGTFFEEQARMLKNNGHQVGILMSKHFMGFRVVSRGYRQCPQDFVDDELPTHYAFSESIFPKNRIPTLLDLYFFHREVLKSYKVYQKTYGKPDVLKAHSVIWGGLAAAFLSKKENIPYVLTEHFSGWIIDKFYFTNNFFKKALKNVVTDSSNSLIVSSSFKAQLEEKYPFILDDFNVFPNMVNKLFYRNRRILKLSFPVQLLMIADLSPNKNHHLVIKAVKILIKSISKIQLKIIGRGERENALMKLIEYYGLRNHIRLLGGMSRLEVMQELKDSHILISASNFESFGINIIEAHGIGCPVVAYNSGGPADLINDRNGILLDSKSPETIASALEFVIKNYNKYNQNQISEECNKKFGEDAIYNRLLPLLAHARRSFQI